MNWYLEVLKKYADFGGRARRKEYWMFVLFNLIIGFVLGFVEGMMGMGGGMIGPLSGLYTLAILIPSIAVATRRLHDTDRSGWWQLIALVPIAGVLILLYFMVQEGQRSANRYGPDPKAPAATPQYERQQRVATPVG